MRPLSSFLVGRNLGLGLLGHMTSMYGFPGGSDGKESACNSGDLNLIPELGRSPEKGQGRLIYTESH